MKCFVSLKSLSVYIQCSNVSDRQYMITMRNKTAKISSHNTVPCGTFLLIELQQLLLGYSSDTCCVPASSSYLLLYVLSNILKQIYVSNQVLLLIYMG